MANAIRALAMDAVQKANSGHPGMPMGMADVATVLFTRFLKFDPADPAWPDRDRFVLSAGHGSMLLYACSPHRLRGHDAGGAQALPPARQPHAGHPEYGHAAGIETTTGPLGQGLGNAVGMALAERMLNARFGDDLVDHYTYVHRRRRLPDGGHQPRGDLARRPPEARQADRAVRRQQHLDRRATDLVSPISDDQIEALRGLGWHTSRVDGHDPEAVAAHRERARKTDRPSLIACRTVIGYGAPNKQGTAATHGSPLGEEEIAGARKKLGWPHAPFEIPADGARRLARRRPPRRGRARLGERLAASDGAAPSSADGRQAAVAGRLAGRIADSSEGRGRRRRRDPQGVAEALEVLTPRCPS
jgi:transketolase